jgi:hypothetical protein
MRFVEKNGRLFYGSEKGHVKELVFENLNKCRRMCKRENKMLLNVDLQ